jgi:hypothetical protein
MDIAAAKTTLEKYSVIYSNREVVYIKKNEKVFIESLSIWENKELLDNLYRFEVICQIKRENGEAITINLNDIITGSNFI